MAACVRVRACVCSGLLAGTSSFEKNKQDITNPELLLEILIGLIQLY